MKYHSILPFCHIAGSAESVSEYLHLYLYCDIYHLDGTTSRELLFSTTHERLQVVYNPCEVRY